MMRSASFVMLPPDSSCAMTPPPLYILPSIALVVPVYVVGVVVVLRAVWSGLLLVLCVPRFIPTFVVST